MKTFASILVLLISVNLLSQEHANLKKGMLLRDMTLLPIF